MRKFYLHDGTMQKGPFSIDDLRELKITKDTYVWADGMLDWKKASEVDELKDVIKSTPPPFSFEHYVEPPKLNVKPKYPVTDNYTSPKKQSWKTIIIVIIILVVGAGVFMTYRDSVAANLEVVIKPPMPRVLNSRTETDNSANILDYKQAVYATVYNEGGPGRVLVTATIEQKGRHFEEIKEIYLREKESMEVYLMFDGPKALGGRIVYDVSAKSIE